MKRFISNKVTWFAVVLALAACGKDNNSKAPAASTPAAAPITVSNPTPTSGGTSNPTPSEPPVTSPAQPSLPVFGGWKVVDQDVPGGAHFKAIMAVSANSVSLTMVCSGGGQSLTSSVTSAAEVSADKIKVLEAKSDPKTLDLQGGHLNCEASLEAKEMSYSVSGDQMTISENGQSLSFPRAQ